MMLQKRFRIAEITVRNTVGRTDGSDICDLLMSHLEQIIRKRISSVEAIGNYGIKIDRVIIEVHTHNRNSRFRFQMLHIRLCHITDNDQTIYFLLLHQKRHHIT